MADLDDKALDEMVDACAAHPPSVHGMVSTLVKALREARAERDKWEEMCVTQIMHSDRLEAQIAAVRELHYCRTVQGRMRVLYDKCGECKKAWPCPTIRALDGGAQVKPDGE